MIYHYNYETAIKKFPKKIQDVVCFGHISRGLFDEEHQKELKEGLLKELATQKVDHIATINHINPTYMQVKLGLWGEDTEHFDNDLGIVCIFVGEDKEYPFPRHFMGTDEIFTFISSVIEKDNPELLI